MKIRRLHIHYSFFLVIIAAYFLGFWDSLLVAYAVIIVHEMAHVIAAGFFDVKLDRFEIFPFGVMIKMESDIIKNPRHELIISLAGPVANVVMFLIALAVDSPFLAQLNASLAIINLVPALPLDGGRALKSYLMMRWNAIKAFNFTMRVTRVSIVIMGLAGVITLLVSQVNFSLLLICAFLIVNFSCENKNHSLIRMRNMIYSREKLDGGVMNCAHIAGMGNFPAGKVLKNFGYNNYYIVDVIDEDMRVMKTITETALFDALIERGIRVKLNEV
jgi:stage IV sporulation protein FB